MYTTSQIFVLNKVLIVSISLRCFQKHRLLKKVYNFPLDLANNKIQNYGSTREQCECSILTSDKNIAGVKKPEWC